MRPNYRVISKIVPKIFRDVYIKNIKIINQNIDPDEFIGFLFFASIALAIFSFFIMPYGLFSILLAEGVFFFVWIIAYVLLNFFAYKKTKSIEIALPDFLQLSSSNIRAGMSIDKAFWFSIRSNFGSLADEMEIIAKKVLSGSDFSEALDEFGNKFDSMIIKRTTKLIIEGIKSGGEMADLLDKLSDNIHSMHAIQKEISANVTTYVIFISFAVGVSAPFLFGLGFQLLTVMEKIASDITLPTSMAISSPMSFRAPPVTSEQFKLFAIVWLSITSIFSSMLISSIKKGSIRETPSILLYLLPLSLSMFFISMKAVSILFSSIISI